MAFGSMPYISMAYGSCGSFGKLNELNAERKTYLASLGYTE